MKNESGQALVKFLKIKASVDGGGLVLNKEQTDHLIRWVELAEQLIESGTEAIKLLKQLNDKLD